jgi:isopenicillin N synthase-like dioxygenase
MKHVYRFSGCVAKVIFSNDSDNLNNPKKCHAVEQNILRALALGFGLEEDWFLQYHKMSNGQLRLHHYPRQVPRP